MSCWFWVTHRYLTSTTTSHSTTSTATVLSGRLIRRSEQRICTEKPQTATSGAKKKTNPKVSEVCLRTCRQNERGLTCASGGGALPKASQARSARSSAAPSRQAPIKTLRLNVSSRPLKRASLLTARTVGCLQAHIQLATGLICNQPTVYCIERFGRESRLAAWV